LVTQFKKKIFLKSSCKKRQKQGISLEKATETASHQVGMNCKTTHALTSHQIKIYKSMIELVGMRYDFFIVHFEAV